jgi:hypothetical protein
MCLLSPELPNTILRTVLYYSTIAQCSM